MTPLTTLAVSADPLGLLVAFGAGMLSFVSPCVLPLVPGYVSMVSGISAAELSTIGSSGSGLDGSASPAGLGARARARARLIRGILGFIAGFTVVFVILGATSSALGHLFLVDKRSLADVSGALIIVFGAFLVISATRIRLPVALMGEHRFSVRPSSLGVWAGPVMGMAFAFAWTPCIGPVLASVLAIAAGDGRGTPFGGMALLTAYSLGLGVPFLLSGLAFSRLTAVLTRARAALRYVDVAGGAVLVAFGVLLIVGDVSLVSSYLSRLLIDAHLSRLATS